LGNGFIEFGFNLEKIKKITYGNVLFIFQYWWWTYIEWFTHCSD